MMSRLLAGCLAWSCLAGCSNAPAPGSAACVPQVLARLPVAFRAGVPTAEARIDGQRVAMVLDLGSTTSVLAETTADRLGLARDPTALPDIVGMGGSETRWAVAVRQVDLGGLILHRKRLEVAQISMGGRPEDGGAPIEGAIGQDVLGHYDIDWNLPQGRVTLAAAAGCAGPPPGWAALATRVPLGHPVDSDFAPGPRLLVLSVRVDGRAMTALLDSGAAGNLISRPAAEAIEPQQPGAADLRVGLTGIGPHEEAGAVHRFASLEVAGETVRNMPMVIGPVPLWAGQMILGVGFLRGHRVWLPAGGSALWVAPPESATAR